MSAGSSYGGEAEAHWVSWVRPGTEEPDFHVPSAFGCFPSGQVDGTSQAAGGKSEKGEALRRECSIVFRFVE